MDSTVNYKKIPHPKQKANIFSTYTFLYTLPLFFKGSKNELTEADLYETLNEHKSSKLGDTLEKYWNTEIENASKKNKSPSLLKVLFRVFGPEYSIFALSHLGYDVILKISQAIFLAQLIEYYTLDQETLTTTEAYLYATGIVLSSLLIVMLAHPTYLGELNIGMKIRIGLCSLIYRKALRLNKNSYQQTTVGQIVNLLSNDVNRFDIVLLYPHYLWIAPVQSAIALYFMYKMVGISAVYGVITMLLFIPLELILAKIGAKLRLKTALRTDKRVGLMSEIIAGIQVIKMYTWEKPFEKFVSFARKKEIDVVTSSSYVRGVYTSFLMFSSRTSVFITIVVYVFSESEYINAKQVFLVTALFNVLRHSITIYLPHGLSVIAETIVSTKRINEFLLYNEQESLASGDDSVIKPNSAVTIKSGSAKWSETANENTFLNLHLDVKPQNLIAVIGTVGSGKTSLLHVILKELPLMTGSINIHGKISYASQESWIFSGDVRQNIIFGEEMDLHRYKKVIKSCALEEDFKLLPHGDKTIVGERGITLSGGQKARINLARAVYQSADVYLLDDPLSAVDTHVGKHIFARCIKEYLSNKTVILITHQLQYLKDVDRIVILENGTLKAEGNYTELTQMGLNFAQLLKSETESNQQDDMVDKRKDSVTSEENFMDNDGPQKVEEVTSEGTISSVVYKMYLSAAGNWLSLSLLVLILLAGQLMASLADYYITFWVNSQQNNDVSPLFNNNNSRKWEISVDTSVYIYSSLTLAMIFLAIVRTLVFFKMCMRASIELHKKMFTSVIFATMRFFNSNTTGRILNRFSKDMGVVDDRLPMSMIETLQIFLNALAIVLIVAIINPWLIIPTVILSVVSYFIRKFYLKTSRALKRLEGVTRSPVFGHLSTSLEGLTTIRALGAQNKLKMEFDKHQDLHSSTWFSFISSATAFGYILDLICVIYLALITYTFFILNDDTYGGTIGLALTQALNLTGMFQYGMKLTADLENHMTSVERVVDYITTIEPEPPLESTSSKKPKPTWPEEGDIHFNNVSMRYSPRDPPVLKDLNFTIKPLEKVGIVGRTGAGKSSLIAALFRLAEIEGQVLIDGVDVGEIGLHDLRSKISIIPQEPVLFSGSLRKNLDPFDQYSDELLWKALEEVELKDAVDQKAGGLSLIMSEGGKNFSLGQRQLVCLARAILQNNQILIMDEATANVDLQTDALIQRTIRKKFANCTVLTIAHRLNTIIDCDKVLVMNAGNMVEFDQPYVLLEDREGYFSKMVKKTGQAMSNILKKLAEDSYKTKIKLE